MHGFLKKILTAFTLALVSSAAYSQKATFEVKAPSLVALGEVFPVEYVSNESVDRFTPPESFDGFDVLAGPATSSSTQISIVGGKASHTKKISNIFTLRANREGVLTIPPATAVIDGREYSSGEASIEVVKEDASQRSGASQKFEPGSISNADIAPDDILLRAVVDKTSVYKGEPVRVTFKLYTRVPIVGLENAKYPAFNGFWPQEIDVRQNRTEKETYNGKIYETFAIREYLLFPHQAGTFNIEQFDLTARVQIVTQRQSRSIWDELMGGGPMVDEVRRKASSLPVKITVKDYPVAPPAEFNGAVGSFKMESEFPSGSINVNSSVNYVIRISGRGNLPLIQAPKLQPPATFEQYNTKATEDLAKTGSGISGYRQFEYPLIARAEGNFTIPGVEFVYFDPQTARFVTLSTREQRLAVLPDSSGRHSTGGGGLVSGLSKEDVKLLGQDIRFIKLGAPALAKVGGTFICSPWYYLSLVALAALFVFLLIYLRNLIAERRNTDLVRGKRANKVALQRLRTAGEYMREGNQRRFYDEMLKALWGYMGDKLNIPVATLTKENVREELLRRGVPIDRINAYIDTISECEYAQYSPGEAGRMQDTYARAMEIISKLESVIKR